MPRITDSNVIKATQDNDPNHRQSLETMSRQINELLDKMQALEQQSMIGGMQVAKSEIDTKEYIAKNMDSPSF